MVRSVVGTRLLPHLKRSHSSCLERLDMKRRMLVVDDEAAIRLTAVAICEVNGFQVQAASSGREAIEALSAAAFDVVVTDLKMETETAGFDVAEFAAKQFPRPIIIVVSAYPKLGMDWKQRGVHAFFEKPTDTSALLRCIEEMLARRDAADAA
jgi:DNA-binding NtrC family response regulator